MPLSHQHDRSSAPSGSSRPSMIHPRISSYFTPRRGVQQLQPCSQACTFTRPTVTRRFVVLWMSAASQLSRISDNRTKENNKRGYYQIRCYSLKVESAYCRILCGYWWVLVGTIDITFHSPHVIHYSGSP